jgi:hypothetical protein
MSREIMGLCQRFWDPGEDVDHRGHLHCLPGQHRLDPKNRVVADLPWIRKIAFTLHKDRVAMLDRSGYPLTPSFMIAWVEAEGYVIQASAFDHDGNGVAQDMIGCRCPKGRNR